MIGTPVCRLARAHARCTFSTLAVTPAASAAHLRNAALIVGPLDPRLDVLDEVRGDHVGVAVLEVVGQEVVGVDAGARHEVDPGGVGHPLHETHVAAAEHRRRIDDRRDPVALGRRDGLGGGGEFGRIVIARRPVLGHRLVAEADVLVDEREAEGGGLDAARDGLDGTHRSGSPHSVSSRNCFLRTFPPGLRGSGSARTATNWGTLKSAICSRT